jgi:hypothetical protein
MLNEGELVKGQNRPEVYVIQGGQRDWIPDSATLVSKWSWGAVQTISPADLTTATLGDPIPSIIDPGPWPDGALITSPPAPEVYVIQGGQRHWIPDPQTLLAKGFDWTAVETIPAAVMAAIPLGSQIPSVLANTDNIVVETGNVFLGAGHWMSTRASFTRASGLVEGVTRTWTQTWFGGFHGGVYAILADNDGVPVPSGATPLYRYGVDGTWIGRSDRTDAWPSFTVPNPGASRSLWVFQSWAPDDFGTILERWAKDAKSVGDLASAVAGVAKVVSAL